MKKKLFLFLFLLQANDLLQGGLNCTDPRLSPSESKEFKTPIPGRLESEGVYWAAFGDSTLIFFYMTPKKYQLAKEMVNHVNENLNLTLGQGSPPCPTLEVMLQALKEPNKDPIGLSILDQYTKDVQNIIEGSLGLEIKAITRYMNLNFNWECLKLHQDQFKDQYKYLSKISLPRPDYHLVEDITLIDWQMSKKTVAGTLIQDGRLGDRFLICVFPSEIVGTLYSEPVLSLGKNIPLSYPGRTTLPPHAVVAPMDLNGSYTSGSAKGKRMSTILRGVALTKQVESLQDKSQELLVNRRTPLSSDEGFGWKYGNGILLKTLPEKSPSLGIHWNYKFPDKENVSIIEVPIQDNEFLVHQIAELFNIEMSNLERIQIKRLTKKDGGFSRINLLELDIQPTSHIILVNDSELPPGYRYFNLAQDFTDQGHPWIQLYSCDPSMAIKIPYHIFNQLSLTPLEDLLYRDEKVDAADAEYSSLIKKLVTNINIFIFSEKTNSKPSL